MSMRGGHWQVGLQATAGPRLASCRPSVKGNRPNGTSERTSAQGSLPGVLQARDGEEEGATWPLHTAGAGQCRGKDRSGAHARACLNSSENSHPEGPLRCVGQPRMHQAACLIRVPVT